MWGQVQDKTTKNKPQKKSTMVSNQKKWTMMNPMWHRMKKRSPSSGQNSQLSTGHCIGGCWFTLAVCRVGATWVGATCKAMKVWCIGGCWFTLAVCRLGATCKAMKVSWLRLRLLSVQNMYNFNYEYLLLYCLTESFTTLCSLRLGGGWSLIFPRFITVATLASIPRQIQSDFA